MLKTETHTPEMAQRVLEAAQLHEIVDVHNTDKLYVAFEHGQHWIGCRECGAQWSVVDAEGAPSVDGFGFEEVSEGDGYCLEGREDD